MHYKEINQCRVCKSKRLVNILDLGSQALSGVFPLPGEEVIYSPIVVCKCEHCHLVQLKHSADLDLMYGDNYGYKSSLNSSMLKHLTSISKEVRQYVTLKPTDVILDIGSNDASYLKNFSEDECVRVGIDPTSKKFREEYTSNNIRYVSDFFSASAFKSVIPDKKPKIITSLACFYDLEDPISFAKQTAEILHPGGVWVIEVAYLPLIISNLCFDGYVAEHLLYFSLRDLKYIMDQANLKISDVKFNDVNGGSIRIVATHNNSSFPEYWRLKSILMSETYLENIETHKAFEQDTIYFKEKFIKLLESTKKHGYKVYGLGASTKFNTVLQYCGITEEHLPAIGEVNDYKFGRVTPGTNIPIISEKEVISKNPDYLIVGPYHFRDFFVEHFDEYLDKGGILVFPLPDFEMYSK